MLKATCATPFFSGPGQRGYAGIWNCTQGRIHLELHLHMGRIIYFPRLTEDNSLSEDRDESHSFDPRERNYIAMRSFESPNRWIFLGSDFNRFSNTEKSRTFNTGPLLY